MRKFEFQTRLLLVLLGITVLALRQIANRFPELDWYWFIPIIIAVICLECLALPAKFWLWGNVWINPLRKGGVIFDHQVRNVRTFGVDFQEVKFLKHAVSEVEPEKPDTEILLRPVFGMTMRKKEVSTEKEKSIS